MHVLHQKLHLQHHRHTGRLLHHKHTSYRSLAIVIGLAGLTIVGTSILARATADSLYVYARIAAPIPDDPAIITHPPDNTVTDKADLTLDGSCPVVTPQVVIASVDNGDETGSVPCDSSNNFSIRFTLQAGRNTLVARSYTITGDTGPDSAPVTVTYVPPAPPLPPAAPVAPSTPNTDTTTPVPIASTLPPLTMTINTPFITFGPQKNAVWLGTIAGGTAPYTFTVNWGDNATETYHLTDAGQLSYQHRYRLMQSYDVTVQVSDSAGQVLTQHYAAVTPYVPPPPETSIFATPTRPIWGGPSLIGVYGAYLLVLSGFGWLWIQAHALAYAQISAHGRPKTIRRARKH